MPVIRKISNRKTSAAKTAATPKTARKRKLARAPKDAIVVQPVPQDRDHRRPGRHEGARGDHRGDRSNRIDIDIGNWAGERVDVSETRKIPAVLRA